MEIKTTLEVARECNDGNEGKRWVAVDDIDDLKKDIEKIRDGLSRIRYDLDAISD